MRLTVKPLSVIRRWSEPVCIPTQIVEVSKSPEVAITNLGRNPKVTVSDEPLPVYAPTT